MKRVLALYLPYLATERPQQDEWSMVDGRWSNEPRSMQSTIDNHKSTMPVVTISPQGQTIRVVHLNAWAEAMRLRQGQTLAEARAIVPGVITRDDDPLADRRELESLAVWAQCLSPMVHIEAEDTLIVDATGCERVFAQGSIQTSKELPITNYQLQQRGEVNLLRRAIEGVRDRGFTVRAAIADTAGAAWALAHAGEDAAFISEHGVNAVDLLPLPAWSLRIDAGTVASLRLVGVETVGALLHLPRSSLASRFGDHVLERIDQALGDLPEVLTPYVPQPAASARLEWGTPIGQRDLLQEAMRRVVRQFCEELARRVAGVRQIMVTFYCPGISSSAGSVTKSVTMQVALSRPTRSARHLFALLRVQLERLRLPGGADSVMIWTHGIEGFDDPQCELFETGSINEQALGDLLDRLAVRLGAAVVVRPETVSDHQPECAFRYVSVVSDEKNRTVITKQTKVSTFTTAPERERFSSRPLRLSPRPMRIETVSLVPDEPPIAFHYQGRQYGIAESVGPERIETGWWRGSHVRRDYYRVVTKEGLHCWLFRDRVHGQWFLHGWFD